MQGASMQMHARWRLQGDVRAAQRCATISRAAVQAVEPPTTSTSAAAGLAAAFALQPLRQQCSHVRSNLASSLLSGGLVFLSAGDHASRNGSDVYYKFRPDSNFFYLAGIAEPNYGLLLDTETGQFTLLAPKLAPEMAFWVGPQPTLEQLAQESGADRCIYLEDLPALLAERHPGAVLHTLEGHHATVLTGILSSGPAGEYGVGKRVTTAFLQGALHRCRARKTDAEVACLLQANKVSSSAHMVMWRACRPGMYEYQLEAAFSGACMAESLPQPGNAGAQLGYPCIVGAGRNAGVLHYERNSARAGAGDLVLVDAGCEHACYTADITRTFPAGGRFSAPQREVYQLVADMQELGLSHIAEGAAWADIDGACRHRMLSGLQELGLVSQSASLEALREANIDRVFMPHGLGHHLGLDVHDVSDDGPVPKQLAGRHVVTCEPGVYFVPLLLDRAAADAKQRGLVNWDALRPFMDVGGVRIEDNVVVLDGAQRLAAGGARSFNLTVEAGCPKGMQDIEAIMRAE